MKLQFFTEWIPNWIRKTNLYRRHMKWIEIHHLIKLNFFYAFSTRYFIIQKPILIFNCTNMNIKMRGHLLFLKSFEYIMDKNENYFSSWVKCINGVQLNFLHKNECAKWKTRIENIKVHFDCIISWRSLSLSTNLLSFKSVMRKTTFVFLDFSLETSVQCTSLSAIPPHNKVKSFVKQELERVNGDIIIRAGVINPINCTDLRSIKRVPCNIQLCRLAKCASREN